MPLGWIGSTTAFGAVGFTGQERREARTVSQSRTRAISDLAVRWFRPPELWSPPKSPPLSGAALPMFCVSVGPLLRASSIGHHPRGAADLGVHQYNSNGARTRSASIARPSGSEGFRIFSTIGSTRAG